ncbi:hypothetical protein I2I05_00380 [Hymenobacter sp. BT683]|uniref:CBM-cenC domain-containing protein n=1 Tax=Hymenobacter jeongseonensis TaxID=2791027 RepID=A0ABS0IC02_9BACT|nr:hypothetical protein [Hymenobacter jeongseonensis]MBF9235840.1 hypothetical protein [Hymenobacter jeongseonensis]
MTHASRMLLFAKPCRAAALALVGLLGLAGCQPSAGRQPVQPRVLMQTGFEELASWLPEPHASLTTEKAYAGKFAIRVDSKHPYSVTYRMLLSKLSPHHRPRRITLSAWAWVPGPEADARFVLSIAPAGDPDHPFFTKYVFLADSRPFGEWKPVSRSLDLPADLPSSSVLVVYMWQAGSPVPVYADDLRITELW